MHARLRWLVLILVVVTVVDAVHVEHDWLATPEWARRASTAATTATTAGVLAWFTSYARAAALAAVGALMNVVVIVANGGAMPVEFELARDADLLDRPVTEADIGHLLVGTKDVPLRMDEIRLPWLRDRFRLWLPPAGDAIYSPGDLVLYAGIVLTAGEALARIARTGRLSPL